MAKKKNKIEKNYEIGGYGFAVILDEIELDDPLRDGDWVPMINEIKLNGAIFETLAVTPIRLSGAHIVFIRKFLNMNQESFAKALGLARHGAVSKWELKGPQTAGMKSGTEVLIRALMREKLGYLEFPLADIRVLVALADQTGIPEPLRLRLIA